MKTAAQMSANWKSGMAAPTTRQKYIDGINSTTVNPMQLAASPEAMNLYLANVQASVASGKRANSLNRASVSTWKQNAVQVGANSLSTGATKAAGKVQAHFERFAPVYQAASAAAKAIPKDGSIGSAMARVQAALQVMMAAAGKT